MMEREVRVYPHLTATEAELIRTLRMPEDTEAEDLCAIRAMLAEAMPLAVPKAVSRVCAVEEKGEDYVVIEGVRMPSPLVRKNLERVHRVVAYVATCGMELEVWSKKFVDPLEAYWADGVKMLFLGKARTLLFQELKERYFQAGDMSSMNPGSLPSWPISQQAPLFELIGQVEESVGVRLTETFLMLPAKSISGMFFSSDVHYENCQYCPRAHCPGRRAPALAGVGTIQTAEGEKHES